MNLIKRTHPMWQKPIHHENLKEEDHSVHWVELFYDLVHAVAVFLLATYLTDNLNFTGFITFMVMFLSLWVSWGDFVFYNSLFVSRDFKHRITSALQVLTVMVMAGSIPSIHEGGLVFFMAAYGVNRIITGLLYSRARRYNKISQSLACEMSRNFLVIGLFFMAAAFLPKPFNLILFGASLIAIQLSYLLPSIGVMRFENFTPRVFHLSERF